jgi:GNAT superfamily N-acetyltransferase
MTSGDHLPSVGFGDFIIRPAIETDIGAMALITARANAHLKRQVVPEIIDIGDESFANIHARLAKPNCWAFVALDFQRVASYVIGYPSSEEESLPSDPSIEYLGLLMADPDYEGYGIASILLKVAADLAKDRGRVKLALWTGEDNTHARRVYEHKGYELTDQTRVSKLRGPQVLYLLSL